MCGIAGVWERDREYEVSRDRLVRMASVLEHRGPDEEGFIQLGSVGLAHRRLSIIDIVEGQQPMASPDGKVWVVYNGEIYNFPELREELSRKGYPFRTRCDTEVLLALYCLDGMQAFSRLNGMFACALWDGRTDRLVLARDRFGKKPLFYYRDDDRFVFGSEIKAILAYGEIDRRINHRALNEYLTFSYIVGHDTIFQGVREVPPGNYLVVKDGGIECGPYWEFAMNPRHSPPTEEEAVEELEAILKDAVRGRLLSDVPLGAFLSGGLDSSVVVALMSSVAEEQVKTFTIGFEESDYSETQDARVVAEHLGTNHTEIIVRPSALEVLPDLVWYLDQPFGDSSAIPTYYVCKAAREHVTVTLSGDGGDEVFAGYTRYRELDSYMRARKLPGWVRNGVLRAATSCLPFTAPGWNYLSALSRSGARDLPVGLGIYPYIKEELVTADLKAEWAGMDVMEGTDQMLAAVPHLDPVSRYQYLDTLQYLPADILIKVDRMSMANSLEVRAPLLDFRLVEFMAGLPVEYKFLDGVTKRLLKRLAGRHLPHSVMAKRKQGFAIPKDQWFRGELRGAAEEILLDPKTVARGYFRKDTVERVLRAHSSGRRDYSMWIWCLLILELWHRTFVDQDPESISPVSWSPDPVARA